MPHFLRYIESEMVAKMNDRSLKARIDAVTANPVELMAEIAELKRQLEAAGSEARRQMRHVDTVLKKLAESQAREAKLRDAILQFRNEPILGRAVGVRRTNGYSAMQDAALSLPHDDTALKEYIKQELAKEKQDA